MSCGFGNLTIVTATSWQQLVAPFFPRQTNIVVVLWEAVAVRVNEGHSGGGGSKIERERDPAYHDPSTPSWKQAKPKESRHVT